MKFFKQFTNRFDTMVRLINIIKHGFDRTTWRLDKIDRPSDRTTYWFDIITRYFKSISNCFDMKTTLINRTKRIFFFYRTTWRLGAIKRRPQRSRSWFNTITQYLKTFTYRFDIATRVFNIIKRCFDTRVWTLDMIKGRSDRTIF